MLNVLQSWDIFFRNASEGVPPGSAYVSPPSIRSGISVPQAAASSALAPATSVATLPAAVSGSVDTKIIDDHLAVQAIIRAYQVWFQIRVILKHFIFRTFGKPVPHALVAYRDFYVCILSVYLSLSLMVCTVTNLNDIGPMSKVPYI